MTDDPTDALLRIAQGTQDTPRIVSQQSAGDFDGEGWSRYSKKPDPWNPPHVLTRAELNGETQQGPDDVILINGDVFDMGPDQPRLGTNLRIQGDQHAGLYRTDWIKPMPPEPSHVRTQLDGIARMSFGSRPGRRSR